MDKTALIISLGSLLAALVSMVVSVCGLISNRFQIVNEFLTVIESKEFISAKNYVYNTDNLSITDEKAAYIVNFFHHWGLLAKKKYLPMWVFDGAVGRGACRLYVRLEMYIKNRREYNSDETYGNYYEWLYNKLKK